MKAGTTWVRVAALCLAPLLVTVLAVAGEGAQSVEELLFGPEVVGPIPEEVIRAVLEKHPEDAQLHYAAAWYLPGEGGRALARAIELDPSFEVVAVAQEAYRSLAMPDRYEALLRRFAELDPENALPHYLLAEHVLSVEKDEAASLSCLEVALSKPDFRSHHQGDLVARLKLWDELGANPSLKMATWSHRLLPYLTRMRAMARSLVERGTGKAAAGDAAGALADYDRVSAMAGHLMLDRPRYLITTLVAHNLLRLAAEARISVYQEQGRRADAAGAEAWLELLDSWRPSEAVRRPIEPLEPLAIVAAKRMQWPADELQRALESSPDFARVVQNARETMQQYLASPAYREVVDLFLTTALDKGEEAALEKVWPYYDSGPLSRPFEKVKAAVQELEEAYPSVLRKTSVIASFELAAAGTLRSLAAAQSTFVARCIVDQDGDGAGEYGYFQELAGGVAPRTRKVALAPGEMFSAVFGRTDKYGLVKKNGYCYVLYLPTAAGPATRERDGAVPHTDVKNGNPQETRWIAYAWPEEFGVTGQRAFAINQQAEVYMCENADGRYNGPEKMPKPGAALAPNEGREQNLDSGFPGPGARGSDGQEWVLAGSLQPPRQPRQVERRRGAEIIRGMNVYETAAAGTLRSLSAAQATFVARCIVDQDGDGAGEYGYFQELGGGVVPRSRVAALAPGEVFSQSMSRADAGGVVKKSGYCYVIYLPTATGPAVTESAGSVPAADQRKANAQETRWIAYAWPQHFASTGTHCFVVNQHTKVYVCDNADGRYNGPENAPKPGAALNPQGPSPENLDAGFPDPSSPASDGQHWVQVEFPR